MASPTTESIALRLTTTSSLLLERSRIISLNLKPSPSSTQQIVRNLTSIRTDLERLASQGSSGPAYKDDDDDEESKELGQRYDRLLVMLSEDDVGREKAKSLKRSPPIAAQSSLSNSKRPLSPASETDPFGSRASIEPPTSSMGQQPFRDYSDDEQQPELTPHDMLYEQQELMNDQDARLNLLANSIGRQNDLSLQIGSELEVHHQLLEEADSAMDSTSASLGRARRRLDKVAEEAKQHGSTITIVVLIFILLILIIAFKT